MLKKVFCFRCLLVLVTILTAALSVGCRSEALPGCDRACALKAERQVSLEVVGSRWRLLGPPEEGAPVWLEGAREEVVGGWLERRAQASNKTGLAPSPALYVRCAASTPQSELAALLEDARLGDVRVLGLGGARGEELWFAALGRWTGAALEAARGEGAVKAWTPGATPGACEGACPVWLLALGEGDCGALMAQAEEIVAGGGLVGIAR
jgi:hypothetical protein